MIGANNNNNNGEAGGGQTGETALHDGSKQVEIQMKETIRKIGPPSAPSPKLSRQVEIQMKETLRKRGSPSAPSPKLSRQVEIQMKETFKKRGSPSALSSKGSDGSTTAMSVVGLIFVCVAFLLSGSGIWVALQKIINLGGAGESTALLPSITVYIAMVIYGWKDAKAELEKGSSFMRRHIIQSALLGVLDVLANFCSLVGLGKIGSSLHQTVGSFITVTIALVSLFWLGRKISLRQWFGLFLITLSLVAMANSSKSSPESTNFADSNEISWGILFTLISTICYAFVFAGCEFALKQTDAPSSKLLAFLTGAFGCILSGGYILFYTIPRWENLVKKPLEEHGGHKQLIFVLFLYFLLVVLLWVRNWSYFLVLCTSKGALFASMLNSVQSIIVFAVSSYFFCGIQPEQCLSMTKGICSLVVFAGVFVYVSAK